MPRILAALAILVSSTLMMTFNASAQSSRVPSTCLAIADNLDQDPQFSITFASFKRDASSSLPEVEISFAGHSTYVLKSPAGVLIATDYSGLYGRDESLRVVTMNHAHTTHYTDFPDPSIEHVLRGWNPDGGPADHHLVVEDVLVRNVTTDIMNFGFEKDGNSIFIFEVAGLCIGHLGHLHHKLSDAHFGKIGRLDVVMVPVDGGMTMSHVGIVDILARLRSSVVLPMHVRGFNALPTFLSSLGDGFAIETRSENKLRLSLKTLPKQPTVIVLPGL
ncbi:MAG: MBL fold metallo-hydrolase [Pseudomonadota bacterium]